MGLLLVVGFGLLLFLCGWIIMRIGVKGLFLFGIPVFALGGITMIATIGAIQNSTLLYVLFLLPGALILCAISVVIGLIVFWMEKKGDQIEERNKKVLEGAKRDHLK